MLTKNECQFIVSLMDAGIKTVGLQALANGGAETIAVILAKLEAIAQADGAATQTDALEE